MAIEDDHQPVAEFARLLTFNGCGPGGAAIQFG